jgi:hypothetical protein
MAERVSTALAQGRDHPLRRKTSRRKPTASVGERERTSEHDPANQGEAAQDGGQ